MEQDICLSKKVEQAQQMHFVVVDDFGNFGKTSQRQRRGTLSLFVPSPICALIDVDALERRAFSNDGFDGSRRISWQWIKCNLARLARQLDGSSGGGPLDPFLSIRNHPRRAMLARIFDARKQFKSDGLTFPGSIADPDPQEKVISLSFSVDLSECCCKIFLTFSAYDEEGLRDSCAD